MAPQVTTTNQYNALQAYKTCSGYEASVNAQEIWRVLQMVGEQTETGIFTEQI